MKLKELNAVEYNLSDCFGGITESYKTENDMKFYLKLEFYGAFGKLCESISAGDRVTELDAVVSLIKFIGNSYLSLTNKNTKIRTNYSVIVSKYDNDEIGRMLDDIRSGMEQCIQYANISKCEVEIAIENLLKLISMHFKYYRVDQIVQAFV